MLDPTETLAALRGRRLDDALEAALRWWRRTRTARLGTLVTRLDRQLPQRSELARALESVVVQGNGIKTRSNLETVCDKWSPDPRLTDHLLSYFDYAPFDYAAGNGQLLCRVVVAQLFAQAEERVGDWLAKRGQLLAARKGTRKGQLSAEELSTIEDCIHAQPPFARPAIGLDAGEEAALDEIDREMAQLDNASCAVEDERQRLFAEVVAAFDDDGAKQVYADWLLEHGDPAGEAILLSLREHALTPAERTRLNAALPALHKLNAALPSKTTYEKGFPVAALTADKYGVRKGVYNEAPEWATVATTDLVPVSDACHTERLVELQVGASFAEELSRLSRPLGVRRLVLTAFNKSSRAAWKRVTVLPAVTELSARGVAADDVDWLLGKSPFGAQLAALELTHGDELAVAVPRWFAAAPRLARVGIGGTLMFARTATGGVTATIDVASPGELDRVTKLLRGLGQESLDQVIVRSRLPATSLRALTALGRTSSIEESNSGVVGRASVERDGERVDIDVAGGDLFDARSFREIVSSLTPPPRRVCVRRNWDARELGALAATATAAQIHELELLRPRQSRPGEDWQHSTNGFVRILVSVGDLVVEIDTASELGVVAAALAQLGDGRRVRLRHAPAVDAATLAHLGGAHEVIPQAELFSVRWVKARKRVAVAPREWAYHNGILTPATVEALLARDPPPVAPAELVLYVDQIALADWIAWLPGRPYTLGFCRDRTAKGTPGFVLRADGPDVVASITHIVDLPFSVDQLSALDGALATLVFEKDVRPNERFLAACAKAARRVV